MGEEGEVWNLTSASGPGKEELGDTAVTKMGCGAGWGEKLMHSIQYPLLFVCLPPDTSLKEEAILISISIAPRLCPANPDVNDLTRTPASTPGKFSFRCMTVGYVKPSSALAFI